MSSHFLSVNKKPGGLPYGISSEASSSVSLQELRQNNVRTSNSASPQQYDSWESIHHQQDDELPEPVLPWMKSESRQSIGSRNSVDTTSLHVVKRYAPDPAIKKKQRWTKHKWWLLVSNTLVIKTPAMPSMLFVFNLLE